MEHPVKHHSKGSSASRAAVTGNTLNIEASSRQFGDSPLQTVCPHCHEAITTTVRFKKSCVGVLSCIFFVLFLGWFGICVGPFLWLALRDAVHECPQCRNLIHRQSRISCPLSSPEGVMTLRFGSCAIVLSRRYCICFAALLTLIIMGHLLRMGLLANTLKELAKGIYLEEVEGFCDFEPVMLGERTQLSWTAFVAECGQKSQLGNPLQAAANFSKHFEMRTVQWQGLVKQVKEGLFSNSFIFVAMAPTMAVPSSRAAVVGPGGIVDLASLSEEQLLELEEEGMEGDSADLALAFDGEILKDVAALSVGDKIRFEATLHDLGKRGRPTVGRLWEVEVVEPWTERERRLKQLARKEIEGLLPALLGGSSGPLGILGGPFASMGSPLNFMSPMLGRGIVVVRARTVGPDGVVEESTTTSDGDTARIIMRVQKPSEESLEKLLETAGSFGNASGRESVASLMESLLHKKAGGENKDDDESASVLGETVGIAVNAKNPSKNKEDIRSQILSQLNRILLGGTFDTHASPDFGDDYLLRVLPQHELDDADEDDHSGEHESQQESEEIDSDSGHSDEVNQATEGEEQEPDSSLGGSKQNGQGTTTAAGEDQEDNTRLSKQTAGASKEKATQEPQQHRKPLESANSQQQKQGPTSESQNKATAASQAEAPQRL